MNEELFQDLRARIEKDQVLVIVGAGVSIGATRDQRLDGCRVASWPGLLEHGVNRVEGLGWAPAEWVEGCRSLLKAGELIQVAEMLTGKLDGPAGGEYQRWLEDTVGHLNLVDREVLDALGNLGVPIATTNYDGLIEEVTGWPAITWKDGSAWQRVINGEASGVLHLHGYWREPASVVLGTRSYERITGHIPAQGMLRALALTKSFLLVGFGAGLQDPNFGALREWMGQAAPDSHYRHYRLERKSEEEKAQEQHDRKERVMVLAYGAERTGLGPFLGRLAPARPSSTALPRPAERVLEIEIKKDLVTATARAGGVPVSEALLLDPLRLAMVQLLEEWLRSAEDLDPSSGDPSERNLREAVLLGRILYRSVFHGDVEKLYQQERGATGRQGRLSLVLKVHPDPMPLPDEEDQVINLTSLPWELLWSSEGCLAVLPGLILSRALPEQRSIALKPMRLRIMIVLAQPPDVLGKATAVWDPEKQQRYEEALREIRASFEALKAIPAVEEVQTLLQPDREAFREELQRARPANIVHYIGYGSFNTVTQRGSIALVRSEAAQWLTYKSFADMFQPLPTPPKLVFLHLCEGPRAGYEPAGHDFIRASFTQLARLLLGNGVQLVVAMQYPMSPDVGAAFTKSFYDNVKTGEMTVAQAVHNARRQAAEMYRLGGPVLYMHSDDGLLVEGGTGTVVAGQKERQADNGQARQRSTPSSGGVPGGARAAQGSREPVPRARLISLEEVQLRADGVARSLGVVPGPWRKQIEQLWKALDTGERDPGLEQLKQAVRERYVEDPNGPNSDAWIELFRVLGRQPEAIRATQGAQYQEPPA